MYMCKKDIKQDTKKSKRWESNGEAEKDAKEKYFNKHKESVQMWSILRAHAGQMQVVWVVYVVYVNGQSERYLYGHLYHMDIYMDMHQRWDTFPTSSNKEKLGWLVL